MTGPVQGRYVLRCGSCRAQVYTSDTVPPDDQDGRLRRFADQSCPRLGVGCPNTTTATLAHLAGRGRPLLGAVTALTPATAVVVAGGLAVTVSRGGDPLTVGDRVVIQHAGGRWVITGRTT